MLDPPDVTLPLAVPPEPEVADVDNEFPETSPEPNIDEPGSEAPTRQSEGAAEQELPGRQLPDRVFESTWADHQPDPGAIHSDALKLALDAESIDSNWGPLLEAAAMSAIPQNRANLLTLAIQCKAMICGIEVRQAGELPEGRVQSEIEAMFLDWFRELSQSVRATGLDFWRIQLASPSVDQNVTSWKVWILRTPPPGVL